MTDRVATGQPVVPRAGMGGDAAVWFEQYRLSNGVLHLVYRPAER